MSDSRHFAPKWVALVVGLCFAVPGLVVVITSVTKFDKFASPDFPACDTWPVSSQFRIPQRWSCFSFVCPTCPMNPTSRSCCIRIQPRYRSVSRRPISAAQCFHCLDRGESSSCRIAPTIGNFGKSFQPASTSKFETPVWNRCVAASWSWNRDSRNNFNRKNHGFDWAIEAREFVNRCITEGNYRPLFEYNKQGRAMQLAVPTPEHYLPLLYILGLRHDPANHQLFNDEMLAGSLSMTSLKVT